MDQQHTENLFRRYKGQLVNIKTVSGGIYQGHIVEVTNDYISLQDREADDKTHTFVLFTAIESFVISSAS
jgi:ribosome maturation factor RimP